MNWVAVLAWLKANWQKVAAGAAVCLTISSAGLFTQNQRLKGELAECKDQRQNAANELDIKDVSIAKLQAAVKERCKGVVDVSVKPSSAFTWNSMMNPYPCPEVTVHAEMEAETTRTAQALASSTLTAQVTEKPLPVGLNGCPSWGLSLGAGLSLPDSSLWHGSAAVDYRALRAIGTLDNRGTWTVGAQARVLTWDWPK